MKEYFYRGAFIFLGILVSFLAHALIEIPTIFLLVSDLEKWGLGLSWESWITIHNIGGALLLLLGIVFGWYAGKHWWTVLYENQKPRRNI